MDKFYYVTAASGKDFIQKFTNYSVRSLIKAGVPTKDIHVVVNDEKDEKIILRLIPELSNIYRIEEDLSYVVWKYSKGKRKYSLFKSAALFKIFPKPVEGSYMIYFDRDVLWYKDPSPFLKTKCEKTWFHHGKDLAERASIKKREVDMTDLNSIKKWCSEPFAYLMHKYGCKKIPDREVVAGLYMLHPRDHEAILKLTYEGCKHNATKFRKHEGGGDQKPMNAAINILEVDWHGGSRFFCPDHTEYFDHYFGKDDMKQKFWKKARNMGL